jgi:GNAT superfamily N-acetyltransferase
MAQTLAAAFAGYRAWAPMRWRPPGSRGDLVRLAATLGGDGAWALVAEDEGAIAGHVALLPGRPFLGHEDLPRGTADLWMLFVRPSWWGTGLAGELHGAFVAEAAARGYAHARLFTPEHNARARRFYERVGWEQHAPSRHDERLDLSLVTLWLRL